ncbi:replication initiator [Kitasatospora sp. NPDC002040]|uniref:replication initiator n=1 Tax=Kitasatospora sp. NPDC002040 TaxID=3154661 RepID=UPI00332E5C26
MSATTAPPVADLLGLARLGTMPALMRQLSGLAGCTTPIRLHGWRTEADAATGQVLHHLESAELPAGHLLVRCGNRRTSRCPSCAETYRRDTFHLITAGLTGGKGTPESVATHPRVFATFTAPSFGPVHNRSASGRCRCGATHPADDPLLGSPLDPERYDYEAAVLWNAHAGKLWARFSIHLRREIAKRAGLTQREFRDHARVSFGKVAEFQKRGAIHFHAVIRLDGPEGDIDRPPAWASAELLTDAIRAATYRTEIPGPYLDGRDHRFAFGTQLDIRPIRSADFTGPVQITERAVAAYIAKYATKGAETATGALDRPVKFLADIAHLDVPEHARRMIRTCWNLGRHPALEELRLRAWAHMLGFRGHFSTKTRRYSTTLGALRDARTAWRRARTLERLHGPDAPAVEETTLVLAHWVYAGTGFTPGESWLAAALQPAPGTEGEPTHA